MGESLLRDAVATLECRVAEKVTGGTHDAHSSGPTTDDRGVCESVASSSASVRRSSRERGSRSQAVRMFRSTPAGSFRHGQDDSQRRRGPWRNSVDRNSKFSVPETHAIRGRRTPALRTAWQIREIRLHSARNIAHNLID